MKSLFDASGALQLVFGRRCEPRERSQAEKDEVTPLINVNGNAPRDDIPGHILVGAGVSGEVAEFYQHLCPAGVYERDGEPGEVTLPVEIVKVGEEELEFLKCPPVMEIIEPVGPAWTLGLLEGDRILSVSGVRIEYWHQLYEEGLTKIRQDAEGEWQPMQSSSALANFAASSTSSSVASRRP